MTNNRNAASFHAGLPSPRMTPHWADPSRAALDPVSIPDPPSVNRFSPNCFSALVEASARYQFGVTSIAKAWFSYSFIYERPAAPLELCEGGTSLNVLLSNVEEYTSYRGERRLEHYYGLALEDISYAQFDALLCDVHHAIRTRRLVITSFDMAFMRGRHEYGLSHSEHLISPIALDFAEGKLVVLNNIGANGRHPLDLDDYRACFEYIRGQNEPFVLTCVHRAPHRLERPLELTTIRSDLEACLSNLFASESTRGLSALRRAAHDIPAAAARLRTRFSVPGLWMFQFDRHNFRSSLPHWREAGVSSSAVSTLSTLLDELIGTWAAAGMVTEGAIGSRRHGAADELERVFARLVQLEERAAGTLERILDELPG
jgi:hypothetical protein